MQNREQLLLTLQQEMPVYDEERGDEEITFSMELPAVVMDERRASLREALDEIEGQLATLEARADELNGEIDRLTNHADGVDYAIAVASGVLCGLMDVFFVGEFSPDPEKLVLKFAKKRGYDGDDLEGAQKHLEERYATPNDGGFVGKDRDGNKVETGIGPPTHRLDDLAHHPTVFGLIASIVVRFVRIGFYVDKNGKWHLVHLKDTKGGETQKEALIKLVISGVLTGFLMWLAHMAQRYAEEELDREIPAPIRGLIKLLAACPILIELFKSVDMWFGHIMSDINTPKGIPGIFLSLLKFLSSMPLLKDTKLPEHVMKLYTSGNMMFGKELAVIHEVGKQTLPVILNEVLVRGRILCGI